MPGDFFIREPERTLSADATQRKVFFVLIAVLYARPCGMSISVPVDNYVLLKAVDFYVN